MMGGLEEFYTTAGLTANLHKSQIVIGRASPTLHAHCLQVTGLQDSNFPIKYLGVPITDGRLSKVECSTLIEKIIGRIHVWATRHLSFARQALLINSVIFGSINCWASIFLLPNDVLKKITQLCRNYLWSGTAEFKRPPHISWTSTCMPKCQGG